MPFYFDNTFILVLIGMAISFVASWYVRSTFNKYNQVGSARGITGMQAAKMILDLSGIQNVSLERVAGDLTDHYDSANKVLRLSDATADSISVAAIGVAAHEVGHAIQDAENYGFLKLRSLIYPVTAIGSTAAFPIILIGVLFSYNQTLINIGLILFSLTLLFQLITLPVEFDASNRALKVLASGGILSEQEVQGSKAVLRAAALTYVAATLASALSLLRMFLLFGGGSRRR